MRVLLQRTIALRVRNNRHDTTCPQFKNHPLGYRQPGAVPQLQQEGATSLKCGEASSLNIFDQSGLDREEKIKIRSHPSTAVDPETGPPPTRDRLWQKRDPSWIGTNSRSAFRKRHLSQNWCPGHHNQGEEVIRMSFSAVTCHACPVKERCTKKEKNKHRS